MVSIIRKIQHTFFIFRCRAKMKKIGKNVTINSPLSIYDMRNIEIGNNVLIQYKAYLGAVPHTGEKTCLLKIEDGTVIGNFNHIYATKSIIIEKNVITADRVYISDNLHGYENINIPILKQPIVQHGSVVIGEGSWLGENVCVLGVEIGKHCVVGSNAVVTSNIPDYCVVVGVPAKIIKRYNFETQKWEKTNHDGSFIKQNI